ncbi:hypothetical protein [Nonlabens xiamenensis]|uniref:hypothetical protein n=1 Tax=Nonlabens xiamenensis TaxID=2341043 RepID=UPI000F61448B|nr:hypothetical protein [Nonlabens xiamenensis]
MMHIEYLKDLRDYPEQYPMDSEHKFGNRGIPMTEIQALETQFNNSAPFPKALRELLFLAGDYCYLFSFGRYNSQQEFQLGQRQLIINANNKLQITRPYYIIDCTSFGDYFLLVYLDEGDDPIVSEAAVHGTEDQEDDNGTGIRSFDMTLSEYIKFGVDNVKKGGSFN